MVTKGIIRKLSHVTTGLGSQLYSTDERKLTCLSRGKKTVKSNPAQMLGWSELGLCYLHSEHEAQKNTSTVYS